MLLLPELKSRFRAALAGLADRPDEYLDQIRRSQDPKFGDYQANMAMPLAKRLRRKPREVAAEIVGRLDVTGLCEPPEIAGPGFINLRMSDALARRSASGGRKRPAAGHPESRSAADVRSRLFGPERGQADARRAHPLDGDRRCAVPRAAVPRPHGHQRQPHRRLGHPVRHDPLRLAPFPRRGRVPTPSGGRACPPVQARPQFDGLSEGRRG